MTLRLTTRNRKLHAALGKFHNRKTEIDGIVFASALEARVYQRLRLREYAGEIDVLRLQVTYQLQPAFTDSTGKKHRSICYVADFVHSEHGQVVVSDAKGKETREFRIKRKLLLWKYPELRFEVVTA